MELTLALCQTESSENMVSNLEKVRDIISEHRADVYLFPELFLTRYGNYSLDPEMVNTAFQYLKTLCASKDIAIAMGAPVNRNGSWYNSLLFFTKEGVSGYDKLYLANFAPYNEGFFEAGSSPEMVEFRGFNIGLEICYDVMFPEIHRNYAVNGADIILVASASAEKSKPAMETVLPARSLENTIYTAYCNNIGEGPAGKYFGGSMVFSPLGKKMCQAGEDEEILLFKMDRSEIDDARNIRHHLEDLRNDIDWF